MPIENAYGWRKRADAAHMRSAKAKDRQEIQAERNRLANEKSTALANGLLKNTLMTPPPPPPVEVDVPFDPNSLTAKQLREALVAEGYDDVPPNTAKARLVEIYNTVMPKAPPPAPPPHTIPALPQE